MPVIIYGAGQIGAVVASVLRETGEDILGFVDDGGLKTGSTFSDLPVLGRRDVLEDYRDKAAVCIGVGTIKARKKVALWLADKRFRCVSAIHPSAIVSPEVLIGANVVVGANCTFYGNASIGSGCYIGPSVTISHDTIVGDFCLLSVGSVIGARVDMSNEVFVGTASTLVEPGFGADARLRVETGAIIGAGSLVIRSVSADTTVIGRPAKILEKKQVTR